MVSVFIYFQMIDKVEGNNQRGSVRKGRNYTKLGKFLIT